MCFPHKVLSKIYRKSLNLCRCIGVILGWALVSLRPSTDLLFKHLRALKKFKKSPLGFEGEGSANAVHQVSFKKDGEEINQKTA